MVECVLAMAGLNNCPSCHTDDVRRESLVMALLAVVLMASPMGTHLVSASSTTVPPCASAWLHITDQNTSVAAGSMNDLYWIKNVSNRVCSLRGFIRAAYSGNYGPEVNVKQEHVLSVGELHSLRGQIGGLKRGVAPPTVTLPPRRGMASFWIAGTDEQFHQVNGRASRCILSYKMFAWLPAAARPLVVAPLRNDGFFWCGAIDVQPIVAGRSGADPPVSLTRYLVPPG